MQGNVPEALWKEVEEAFLVLPEHGWAKNFVKYVQKELGWDLKTTNDFVAWVEPPEGKETLPYMLDQAVKYNQIEIPGFELEQNDKRRMTPVSEPIGFDFECDGCKKVGRPFRSRFAHHDLNEAIEMARAAGWIIRGTGHAGPDDCAECKRKLEAACGRKIRGDGGYA